MFKFNEKHIFTGYLKQMLSDFNLPLYKVYTTENALYKKDHGGNESPTIIKSYRKKYNGGEFDNKVRYCHYIKDGVLQLYMEQPETGTFKWETCNSIDGHKKTVSYYYNKYIPNYTKTLKIKSNTYDTYTHEYLGDYLRFQRDYNNLNLMPLYNCFSNRVCSALTLTIDNNTVFSTNDADYKYYMLPVKLFQKYTIAIDSSLPVEMCCCLYGKYQYSGKDATILTLAKQTYEKYNAMIFNQPVLFDKLYTAFTATGSDDLVYKISKHETDLKLIIKLPANNNSSITILEGDYRNWNDRMFNTTSNEIQNHSITNYEDFYSHIDYYSYNYKLITNLQLLKLNTKESYPFADRLLEYLLENTSTQLENNADNIRRAQAILKGNEININFDGIWDTKYKYVFYDYMNNDMHISGATTTNNSSINHDILGYVDKDVEKYYSCKTDVPGKVNTIGKINIYESEDN